MPNRTIADNLNLIIETKEGLQDEIYWKGVEIDDSTPFSAYPEDITSIGVVTNDLLSAYACDALHVRDITISGTIRPRVLGSTGNIKGTVTLDSSVQTLPSSAFSADNHNIKKIVMQETTTIGARRVFSSVSGLTHLETVTLNPSHPNSSNSAAFIYDCRDLRHFLLKGIGSDAASSAFFDTLTNWGVNSDDEPNAKQSLHDSLITYSINRSELGKAVQDLHLSPNTVDQLTDEEKVEIADSGYSISVAS